MGWIPKSDDIDERFEAHIAPMRNALARLLDEADRMRDAAGWIAAADSRAMAELEARKKYSGNEAWGDEPASAAHNHGQLLLVGADDCARAMIRLLTSGSTPVYAHMVLARAVLEHAGRAWSLLDPRIGVRLRIARIMNERLYAFAQQEPLPIDKTDKKRAPERRAALFAEAQRLNFEKVGRGRRSSASLVEERMGQTALVRELLRTGKDTSLGNVAYAQYSAVAHGTVFGLTSSLTTDAPGLPTTPGVTWAAVHTNSGEVVSVLVAVAFGVREAYAARNALFGWTSTSWNSAERDLIRVADRSLPTRSSG
jgi:hypothetical protein